MKFWKGAVVFGAGAAVGYLLATNRVEMNVNIDPIVDKIKTKLNDVMNHEHKEECAEESCDCGSADETESCDCGCSDETESCGCEHTDETDEEGGEPDFANA